MNTYLPNLETGLQRDYGVAFPSEYRRIAHGVEERLEQKGLINETQYGGGGAEPLMQFDLQHIFEHMPKGCTHYYLLRAFMSLGLCCGARGVSLVNLKWKHLKVIQNQAPHDANLIYVTLTVNITVTKGGKTDHSVTFQGNAQDSSCMNPFCHLNQLSLLANTGCSLLDFDSLTDKQLDSLIFDATPDAMSGFIRTAASNSGYPKDMFTLRSGFLCKHGHSQISESTDCS